MPIDSRGAQEGSSCAPSKHLHGLGTQGNPQNEGGKATQLNTPALTAPPPGNTTRGLGAFPRSRPLQQLYRGLRPVGDARPRRPLFSPLSSDLMKGQDAFLLEKGPHITWTHGPTSFSEDPGQ